jgi:two-component system, NarL family, nitrate/nitrite response regulator NarL
LRRRVGWRRVDGGLSLPAPKPTRSFLPLGLGESSDAVPRWVGKTDGMRRGVKRDWAEDLKPEATVNPAVPRAVGQAPVRVILALRSDQARRELHQALEDASNAVALIATVPSAHAVLAHDALPKAQVLLLGLELFDDAGLDLMTEIGRRSNARVIILAGDEPDETLCRAIEGGAKGVLEMLSVVRDVRAAIAAVHSGGAWLSPVLLNQVLERLTRPQAGFGDGHQLPRARAASLTPREREVVLGVCRNPNQKLNAVASELAMSVHTLRNHLTTIYGKLGVQRRLELQENAARYGLLDGKQG